MTKYHISPKTGMPNICRATTRNCPISGDSEHFDSKEAAKAYSEKSNEDLYGKDSLSGVSNKEKTASKAADPYYTLNNVVVFSNLEEKRKNGVIYFKNGKTGKAIRFKKEYKSHKPKLPKPLHFLSSDDIDIYVGKNNIQNDYLTLKFANKNDMWLHTKDIPGSHVIIKNIGDIPEITLLEAGNLSAYFSKSQNSSSVPVDYTQVRNVKKPSGSKPGMVIYTTNKTIYVTPCESTLERVE